MRAEVFGALINAALASSAALLIVGLLRKPLRVAVGARSAYWLWMLVPAVAVAVLLPAPSLRLASAQGALPQQLRAVLAAATVSESASYRAALIGVALTAWVVGAATLFFAMLARQRSFRRSLGTLTRDADGLYRADAIPAPMLLGAWHPQIVVPRDFEARYAAEERELILAHERAHESRRDIAVNVFASFALCLSWFNPLMYRGLAWLRIDQEFACDALVLGRSHDARRRYADALLRAQLAAEPVLRQPLGCHWQSVHPLKERISMLKRPLPGPLRRRFGVAFVVALTAAAGYEAWAGQAAAKDDRLIVVGLKVTVANAQGTSVHVLNNQYLVHPGETIQDASAAPLDFACTAYLADQPGHATDWSDQKARSTPLPVVGQVLVDCAIRRDGKVVERPAVITGEGKLATIETLERGGTHRYRFEITASTSPEEIAAASKHSGER